MPGALNHTPAGVLARLLIEAGSVTDPDLDPLQLWPVYTFNEPGLPDQCVTIYDTQGLDFGRTQVDGERQGSYGFQVRVRAADPDVAYARANQICMDLDSNGKAVRKFVTLGTSYYVVHGVTRTSDPIAAGYDAPASRRPIVTINGLVIIRKVTAAP